MHHITPDAVVIGIGIDTHKDVHVAIAVNGLGARLATASFPVTSEGYRQVAAWAAEHGTMHAFGIEGTGSYGAGLTRALVAMDLRVIEVGRVNRQLRRRYGKTDRSMPSLPHVPSWRVTPMVSPNSAMAPSR